MSKVPPALTFDRIARALSLLALLVWALLPPGVMPVRGGAGEGMTVTLCTGAGPVSVTLDGDGSVAPVAERPGGPSEHTSEDKEPCPFASVHMAAAEGIGAVLPAVVDTVAAERLVLPAAQPGPAASRFARPESRGPPLLS